MQEEGESAALQREAWAADALEPLPAASPQLKAASHTLKSRRTLILGAVGVQALPPALAAALDKLACGRRGAGAEQGGA